MSNAKQRLHQQVLQKYGWSATFDKTEDGYWYVDVTVGLHGTHRFVAETNTIESSKEGVQVTSALALEGLRDYIQREEAKPVQDITHVFPNPIVVKESNEETWNYFWTHKPSVVGIDTEGNQISPPVLLQIATDDYTIIEVPTAKRISIHAQRLLNDNSIVKVFCDNFSHRDKTSLGLAFPTTTTTTRDLASKQQSTVVDLESMCAERFGPVQAPRGILRIYTLASPEIHVRIEKSRSSVKRFSFIEQGRMPRLRSISDLSQNEQEYAALDAWVTLQAYKKLLLT